MPDGSRVDRRLLLRHDRDVLTREAWSTGGSRRSPGGGRPTPELLYASEEFIVVSLIEGEPWDKADGGLPAAAKVELRRELGAITARLHTLDPEDGRSAARPSSPPCRPPTGGRPSRP